MIKFFVSGNDDESKQKRQDVMNEFMARQLALFLLCLQSIDAAALTTLLSALSGVSHTNRHLGRLLH